MRSGPSQGPVREIWVFGGVVSLVSGPYQLPSSRKKAVETRSLAMQVIAATGCASRLGISGRFVRESFGGKNLALRLRAAAITAATIMMRDGMAVV
jgi:hypothetical protein